MEFEQDKSLNRYKIKQEGYFLMVMHKFMCKVTMHPVLPYIVSALNGLSRELGIDPSGIRPLKTHGSRIPRRVVRGQ